jgi:hypothetical protein
VGHFLFAHHLEKNFEKLKRELSLAELLYSMPKLREAIGPGPMIEGMLFRERSSEIRGAGSTHSPAIFPQTMLLSGISPAAV